MLFFQKIKIINQNYLTKGKAGSNMKVMAGGLKEAMSMEAAKNGTKSLSKSLSVGTKYRLIFRKVGENELLVASAFGRNLDYNALGATFMGFEDDELEYNPETRLYKDVTVIPRYVRMARVLHAAACEREKRAAEALIRKTAEDMGNSVHPEDIAKAVEQVQQKYFGNRDVKPAVAPEVKPVISGVTTPHIIEAYAIPLDSQGKPEFQKGFVGTVELKNNKMTKLASILQTADYNNQARDYLEVGFDYLGKDKAEAGREAKYEGVAESLLLETKFPDLWEANKDDIFRSLSKTEDEVFSRCITFKFARSVKDVVAAFNKYASTQASTLSCIDFESEDVKGAAEDFVELDIVKRAPKILTKFNTILAEQKSAEQAGAAAEDAEVEDVTEAKRLSEVKKISELAQEEGFDSLSGIDEL